MRQASSYCTKRGFCRESSGVAAVEFAIILPLMLLIYLGGFDAMRLVRCASVVENASKTTADLTAQEGTASANPASDIATILQAATVAAAPFNGTGLTITVSAIDLTVVNSVCCSATVRWSVAQGGSLRPCNTTLTQIGPTATWAVNTIPAKIASQGLVLVNGAQSYAGSVIVTDVSYPYAGVTPVISGFVSTTVWRHSYSIPRLVGQVTLASTSGLATGQTGIVCPTS